MATLTETITEELLDALQNPEDTVAAVWMLCRNSWATGI